MHSVAFHPIWRNVNVPVNMLSAKSVEILPCGEHDETDALGPRIMTRPNHARNAKEPVRLPKRRPNIDDFCFPPHPR